ncbi:MAG: hypothetical protein OXK76_08250 [Gammaproteobacteria bacterium]|nr:hypothetical protein [Gammaproteobacteria bacterium]
MPRKPPGAKLKGSQRWLQVAVNRCPTVIDSTIQNTGIELRDPIVWVSPLESDGFSEYMDAAFLKRLGVSLHRRKLGDFWPSSGPRWDALARSGDSVLLVEAKANIRELHSSPCGAQPKSLAKIRKALNETRAFLNVESDTDWTRCFYQYANRLAHLYLLRELNCCNAYLVFVYFVHDQTTVPVSRNGWDAAVALAKTHLGLPQSEWMSRYVKDVYIDTANLSHVDWPP